MKLKNTFVGAKMNKDIDERLLPKGQYPHAENIRVSNSDASDMGAIENVRGNKKITNLNLTNAKTIGSFSDTSNEKLYWFITSPTVDLVVEYNIKNDATTKLLESTSGLLNFSKSFLITGVTKIINGDSDRDLLVWTDDRNAPRMINIERAKTYGTDGFDEDDISVIKRPPRKALTATPVFSTDALETLDDNEFRSFSYRYVYEDGQKSALASFTNYSFTPSSFKLDFQTMENEGMVNTFNAVELSFNVGDSRVKSVEIISKVSNSNNLFLVESFDKESKGWADETTQTFLFTNSKSLTSLPVDELFRTFDNVPLKAKALELIGTRLAFGNYVEQYDLVDVSGNKIALDYTLSQTNKEISGSTLPISFNTGNQNLRLDFTGIELREGTRVTWSLNLNTNEGNGDFQNTFDYVLNSDYNTAQDLGNDPDFASFIEEVMTNNFTSNFSLTPPENAELTGIQGFFIESLSPTSITIQAPTVSYLVDDTPTDPNDNPANTTPVDYPFIFSEQSTGFFSEVGVATSVKTNRSYEVGLKYLDKYGRATTVLTTEYNTIDIKQEFSTSQNRIVAEINHNPPVWADRYKLVVKQNKFDYQTIYTNLFYEDGLFRWVKIEGANVNKVREGDILIVKSDLGGVREDVVRVRVLELETKEKDFIEGNENEDGSEIIEESGLYMKIKPIGFDMNFTGSTARTYTGGSHLRYPVPTYTQPDFGETNDEGVFTPYVLNAGSTVRINIKFSAKGSIAFTEEYDQTFRVSSNYTNIKDWFEAEVVDLGQFGEDFCRGGYQTGFGFDEDSSRFFAWAWRDGTASRNITTNISIEVLSSEGIVIFETEPKETLSEQFFETEDTYDIVDNKHTGNIQDQGVGAAIVELDFFNCYVQGNGAESYRYKDALVSGTDDSGNQITANYLSVDLRPSLVSLEEYRQVRRFSDITYSDPYSENSNLNGLSTFNLSKANFKEDIDKKYGFIQLLYSRDTDLVVFQEDKVSRVLFGKDLLVNADGSSNVSSIEEVLGQQITYAGEYGISRNPESFCFNGFNLYFTDVKRGAVMRLGRNGLTEISANGLRTFFKDEFINNSVTNKIGGFDPYVDQYVLFSENNIKDE